MVTFNSHYNLVVPPGGFVIQILYTNFDPRITY